MKNGVFSDWTEGYERGGVYTECQKVKLFS